MDWDGNELLLSDILGTDEDVISPQGWRHEAEHQTARKRAINKAFSAGADDRADCASASARADGKEKTRERGRRSCWGSPSLTFPDLRKRLSEGCGGRLCGLSS